MRKTRKLFAALIVGLFLLAPAAMPAQTAQAVDIKKNLCGGAEVTLDDKTCINDKICDAAGKNCKPVAGGSTDRLNSLISNVINILSLIAGIIAVIMIVVSGFKYITSSGDSAKVSSAKTTIIYAIIGLVIVALAQIIVRFVLGKATGATTGP